MRISHLNQEAPDSLVPVIPLSRRISHTSMRYSPDWAKEKGRNSVSGSMLIAHKTMTLFNFEQDAKFHQEHRVFVRECFNHPKRYFYSETKGERNPGQIESLGVRLGKFWIFLFPEIEHSVFISLQTSPTQSIVWLMLPWVEGTVYTTVFREKRP